MLFLVLSIGIGLGFLLIYIFKTQGEEKDEEPRKVESAADEVSKNLQSEEMETDEIYSIKKFKGILSVGQNIKATFENIRDSTFALNQFILKSRSKRIESILSKDERKELAEKMRDHYSRVTSWLIPLPWLKNRVYATEEYFVEPNIVECSRDGKKSKQDIGLSHVFSAPYYSHLPPKRILLRGEAGYGKTTVCVELAQSWATKKRDSLNDFKYLIFFRLRDLNQSNNVENALKLEFQKFLSVPLKESELNELIRSLARSLLLILDGYDECKIEQLNSVNDMLATNSNVFSGSTILITSRYPPSTTMFQYFSKHLLITGFTESKRDLFLEKFIGNLALPGSTFREKFVFLYETNDMSPLMLYLLSFVLESGLESKMYSNFTSKSSLLDEVIRLLGLRYCERHDVKMSHAELNKQFKLIGQLFHQALRNGENFVSEADVSEVTGLTKDLVLQCGILIKRSAAYGHVYEPLHKLFMEHMRVQYCQWKVNTSEDEEQLRNFLISLRPPVCNNLSAYLESNDIYLTFEVFAGFYFRFRIERIFYLKELNDHISLNSSDFIEAEKYNSLFENIKKNRRNNLNLTVATNYGNNSCSIMKTISHDNPVTYLTEMAARLQFLTQFLQSFDNEIVNLYYVNSDSSLYEMNRLQGMEKVTMFLEVQFALAESWYTFSPKMSYALTELLGCRDNKIPIQLDDLTFVEYIYGIMSSLATNRFGLDVFFELQAPNVQFRYLCKYEASKSTFRYLLQRRLGPRSKGVVKDDNFILNHLDDLSDIYFTDAVPEGVFTKRPYLLRYSNRRNSGNFKLHLKLFNTWDIDPILSKLHDGLGITNIFSPTPLIELFSDDFIEVNKRYLCVFVSCM